MVLRVVPLAQGKIMNQTAAKPIRVANRVRHTTRAIMFLFEFPFPTFSASVLALEDCESSKLGSLFGIPDGLSVILRRFISSGSNEKMQPSPINSPQISRVLRSHADVSVGPNGRIYYEKGRVVLGCFLVSWTLQANAQYMHLERNTVVRWLVERKKNMRISQCESDLIVSLKWI